MTSKLNDGLPAKAFTDLAQTLVGDFDIAETLDRIIGHCITACGAAGVGLVVKDAHEALRDIAYSDETVRQLERRQVTGGEGPCFDCVHTGEVVWAKDLTAAVSRWPFFAPAALDAGFHGVRAMPLRYRHRTLGALNLFDADEDGCAEDALRTAQVLADLAVLAVVQHALPSETAAVHIAGALAARSAIERAKGMLAHDANTTTETAFHLLREHATRTGQGITALAHALVSGRTVTADVLAARSS
jgi:transcriptional regulator with GAF, ATPase, and Fis domain